ncbi:Alpha-N-acetylgalactosaminidase [Symmachiella macrocystis]|uniref:Alpha-N-acetylgalactosaminidase n=1 Tax=Symmachiella macrocystis TaxID=2527985 RepID=A0A5C6BS93_9PLAN|nr:Gfo/Idh/MocA family oxidoreductase [Symmachiella macrocystis]TWU13564.1 Alpha-N-acetylgalactosaminidase [Symmachiella macrocystis]
MSIITRRRFLQTSTAAAGASLLLTGTQASGKVNGANDRVRIAVAGLNGRGKSHLQGWLGQKNVEVAYVIDPDQDVLDRTLKALAEKGVTNVKGAADVREALEDKNVDAISVATPNHWHSLITIWAAQHGKHVYVEKPMSHDIAEGRIAVEAQKKYGVVVQHGTQRRSNAQLAGLVKEIQDGKFGKLKISYGYCCKPRGGIGHKSPTTPPSNLNWDLWKGPAQIDQYHPNFVHYNWHWFWETGNGDMNNQGTHQLDVARWALDEDQTHPVRVMGMGGRFQWNDQGETPNTMFAVAEYPNGQYVYFNVRNVNYKNYKKQVLNEYYFEDGGKILPNAQAKHREGGDYWRYFAKGDNEGVVLTVEDGDVTPGGNWGAFIAAVREGNPDMANGNALDAHYGCVLGHIMNNSYRLGVDVPFNSKAGKFGENTDAYEHFTALHDIMSKDVGLSAEDNKYTVGPWLTFDGAKERHTGDHAEAANSLLKDANTTGFEIPLLASL